MSRKGLKYSSSESLSNSSCSDDESESCKPCKIKVERGPCGKRGEKGDRGEKGERGRDGARGAQGPPGVAGARGPVGPTGPKGNDGNRGPMGPIGAVGPKGDKGDRGPKGDIGPEGVEGKRGKDGPVGPRGPAGCQGERGKIGPTGATGAKGPTGARGPTGSGGGNNIKCISITGRGQSGNFPPTGFVEETNLYFLETDNGYLYTSISGSWVSQLDLTDPYYFYSLTDSQIYYVVPPSVETQSNGSSETLVQHFPDLKTGDKVIDSCSGKLYELQSNGQWWCCSRLGGNKFNCISIAFEGRAGFSLPREQGFLDLEKTYFLVYGNDADLFRTTGLPYPNFFEGVNGFDQTGGETGAANNAPYFYFERVEGENVGRIWFVEPIKGATSTNKGRATRYEIICNLQDGDMVLDVKSGKIYTLHVAADGQTMLWSNLMSYPCGNGLGRNGPTGFTGATGPTGYNCQGTCTFIQDVTTYDPGISCTVGVTGPYPGDFIKNGCIKYRGRCGPSNPTSPPYTIGEYFLDIDDADLWVVALDSTGKKNWDIVKEFTPYLYFCIDDNNPDCGTIYEVIPQPDPVSTEPGTSINITNEFALQNGTKFFDCCSGIIYTLRTYTVGTTGPSGATGTAVVRCWDCSSDYPSGVTGTTAFSGECCRFGSGQQLECIEVVLTGVCCNTVVGTPVESAGTNLLILNDGTLYTSNGTAWVLNTSQTDDYYFQCIKTCPGVTGPTGPNNATQIYFVPVTTSQVPITAATYLGLKPGDKILECSTSTFYQLNTDRLWELCCEITGNNESIKTGCIKYSGYFGTSTPTIPPYKIGEYFLDADDADLWQVTLSPNGTKNWDIVKEYTPYLYLGIDPNNSNCFKLFQVNPQPNPSSTEPGTTFEISDNCGLKTGTKFFDCCSGIIYTLRNCAGVTGATGFGWQCLPDFPIGLDCSLPFIGITGPTGCCKFGSGNRLECVNIELSGVCCDSVRDAPVETAGTFLLILNDGSVYVSNGTNWILDTTLTTNFYYQCVKSCGATGPSAATQIYFVPREFVGVPETVGDHLNLRPGDKILDCVNSTFYEMDDDRLWEVCCALPEGVTGATGPVGPTGPNSGFTGATGPTGIGSTGPTGASGLQGATGNIGPTGPQGPAGGSAIVTFSATTTYSGTFTPVNVTSPVMTITRGQLNFGILGSLDVYTITIGFTYNGSGAWSINFDNTDPASPRPPANQLLLATCQSILNTAQLTGAQVAFNTDGSGSITGSADTPSGSFTCTITYSYVRP